MKNGFGINFSSANPAASSGVCQWWGTSRWHPAIIACGRCPRGFPPASWQRPSGRHRADPGPAHFFRRFSEPWAHARCRARPGAASGSPGHRARSTAKHLQAGSLSRLASPLFPWSWPLFWVPPHWRRVILYSRFPAYSQSLRIEAPLCPTAPPI